MSGIDGKWEIIALIAYDGSMSITPITMIISASKDNYSARFSPDTSYNALLPTYWDVTTFMAPGQVLAVGCEDCNNGEGQINFYDARTLNRTYELKGDKNHKKVGKQIVYRLDTGYSENFWYTSTSGSKITLNTMLFFKFVDNNYWDFEKTEDLVTITGSDLVYTAASKNNFLYKANYSKELRTFVSCNFNSVYNSDDTDKDKYNDTHILAYRNCTKCPSSSPFSYGYQADECRECDEFAV